MTVGDRIKQKRLDLGLTQQDLAERMGYKTKSDISRVERDYEQNLTLDRVALFAEALNVTPAFLMGWEDESGAKTILGQLGEAKMNSIIREEKQQKANDLYDRFENADPVIRRAVAELLGVALPDADVPHLKSGNDQ